LEDKVEIKDELLLSHNKICDWIKNKPSRAVRSSEPHGRNAVRRLKKLVKNISLNIPEDLKSKFSFHISTGKSNLPTVLWVSLTPKGASVYSSMSVTACFSFEATGSVLGIMDAVTLPQCWLPTIHRKAESSTFINLNKLGAKYLYNDKYVNPKEFSVDSFSSSDFISHIIESCEILSVEVEKRKPKTTFD
jgi:hypothetical protein